MAYVPSKSETIINDHLCDASTGSTVWVEFTPCEAEAFTSYRVIREWNDSRKTWDWYMANKRLVARTQLIQGNVEHGAVGLLQVDEAVPKTQQFCFDLVLAAGVGPGSPIHRFWADQGGRDNHH
jgi:hypothetical protein